MMKKVMNYVVALFTAIVLFSCSSEDDPSATTYTLNWEIEDIGSMVTIETTIFEYNSNNEKVGNTTSFECYEGLTKTFTANSLAEKVKVYIKTGSGSSKSYKWVQQVFYLKKGSNIDINITGETMVGSKEP